MKPIWSILLLIYILVGQNSNVNSSDRPLVTIPVNVAYNVHSLWTNDEIIRRFRYNQDLYAKACKTIEIKLELKELIQIHSSELQDIHGWMTESSVLQIKSILSQFKTNIRPTIIYVRNATHQEETNPSNYYAQAYIFSGPRALPKFKSYPWNEFEFANDDPIPFTTGNLDWSRFDELKAIHGTTVIAQGLSEKDISSNDVNSTNRKFRVDAHELGHIFLNDESHRKIEGNLMDLEPGDQLTSDQCELIGSYHQQELQRESAVFEGMWLICSYAEKINYPHMLRPRFCETINLNIMR